MDSFVIFEDAPSDGVWKAMIIKAIIFVVLGIFCLPDSVRRSVFEGNKGIHE